MRTEPVSAAVANHTLTLTLEWMVSPMRNIFILSFAVSSLALAACSDDPGTDPTDEPDAMVLPPLPDANPACPDPTSVLPDAWRPINSVAAGEVQTLEPGVIFVDGTAGGPEAAAENPYIYIRFEAEATKVAITDTDSYAGADWDIALKRTVIRANGGDSGPGGVSVAAVPAATLDEVTMAPEASAFATDDWVSDDCMYQGGLIGEPLTAIGTWYDYDLATNRPTPMMLVYVVTRADGTLFKVQFRSYYHNDMPGGNYQIAWAPL